MDFSVELNIHNNVDVGVEGQILVEKTDIMNSERDEDMFYRHPSWAIVILVVGYVFVLCLGVLGNIVVIVVVIRSPRMRTVTNFFICNLATADLLVLIFCLLPTLMSNIFVPWLLGAFLCKAVAYIQGVSVCASVYSLVAISVDRCLAIHWPLRCQITKKKARGVIMCIWLLACLVTTPWAIFFHLTPDKNHPEIYYCVEIWPEGFDGSLYFLLGNMFLCYLLPLGMITLCYVLIYLRVWRRHVPSDSHLSRIELIHQRAKVGVLKMLLVVILVFVLSWLPLYYIFTRLKFGGRLSESETEVISFALPIAQWLGAANSCINPIIYAFLNVKFRRAFYTLISGHKWRRTSTPHYQKPHLTLKKCVCRSHTSVTVYNVTEV